MIAMIMKEWIEARRMEKAASLLHEAMVVNREPVKPG